MTHYYWIIDNNSTKALNLKKNLLNLIPNNWIQDYDNSEFIFVIGGDGTFLRNQHHYKNKKIVAINGGDLGFCAYFNKNNLKYIIKKIENENNFEKTKLLCLEIDNKQYFGLNEIFIRSDKVLDTKVYLKPILLQHFKGSGLMISTQLGSTAHAKNASGAIISPNLDVIQFLEIEPIFKKKFNTIKSPLILSGDSTIILKSDINNEASIIVDGITLCEKFNKSCIIKTIYSDFKIFKLGSKKEYWKKVRDSFVRD